LTPAGDLVPQKPASFLPNGDYILSLKDDLKIIINKDDKNVRNSEE